MRKVIISMLFILVSLTWGTTWLAMRIAVETIPPIFATGMRFIFASPFFNLHCIANQNTTFISNWAAIFSIYNLYILFLYPFYVNDLW